MSLFPTSSTSLSPGTLKKSSSCSNVTHHVTSHSIASDVDSPQPASIYTAMKQTILAEIKNILPSLVTSSVQKEMQTMLKKRDELKREISDLRNKVAGYKTQVDRWIEVAKFMENTTLPKVVQDVATLETSWKNKEKSITNKTKDLLSTQNKLQSNMSEISNLQNEWEKLLKAKTDGCDIRNIEQSQQFVSDEYDEFREKQKNLVSTVASLEEKVAKQEVKSEHNANYPRWDSVEVAGIPLLPIDEFGNENCKKMIMDICKELHYWLPLSAISTAHRLKKTPKQAWPPSNDRQIHQQRHSK